VKRLRSKQVGIRLPAEFAERLDALARRDGTTAGKLARRMVLDALGNTEQVFVREELAQLRDDVTREFGRLRKQIDGIKEAIALCFTATMVDGLQHDDHEVEKWVRENVLEGGPSDGHP
jgi:predicted DNA-binding protein